MWSSVDEKASQFANSITLKSVCRNALISLCSYIPGRTIHKNILAKWRVPFQKTKIFGPKILSYIVPFVWHFNFWSYHTFTVTHTLYVCSKYFIYLFTFVFIHFLVIIYLIVPLFAFFIFFRAGDIKMKI